MPSTLRLLQCVCLLWATTSDAAPTPAPIHEPRFSALVAGNVSLRIMPLGASITYGEGSSTGNGYRQYLKDLLNADGNPVDYVGSRQGGDMADNDVEGWPGYRIAQVTEKANESLPDTLPNLVLINAGTNDCIQNSEPETAGDRMLEMLRAVWAASPRVSIVLSTLLVNKVASVDECVRGVNEQFRALVEAQQAISKKVVLVDFHSPEGPTVDDLVDDIHPGDAGFEKMAAIWFEGIKDAASRGWVEEPQVLPGNETKRSTLEAMVAAGLRSVTTGAREHAKAVL
ncbi:hypothetical protein VDGE_03508 [Verticillium dahliae]|uniref:SGNH hydrolase-type esterase domain-containing protein n=1 Tax=Verticillium dahliae TaxID=27337 RepID=A0A444RMW3_VERDA|nr:hypothetical protein VDGE_03508 [Verticillium dahliae]